MLPQTSHSALLARPGAAPVLRLLLRSLGALLPAVSGAERSCARDIANSISTGRHRVRIWHGQKRGVQVDRLRPRMSKRSGRQIRVPDTTDKVNGRQLVPFYKTNQLKRAMTVISPRKERPYIRSGLVHFTGSMTGIPSNFNFRGDR